MKLYHHSKKVISLVIFFSFSVTHAVTSVNPAPSELGDILGSASQEPLILLDNDHSSVKLRDILAEKLGDLKQADPRINCLFLEADRRIQPAVDLYDSSSQENFRHVQEAYNKLSKKDAYRVREDEDVAFAMTEKLLQSAKAHGIRVYAADLDFSTQLGRKSQNLQENMALAGTPKLLKAVADTVLSARNQSFARFIAEKSGQCHRSLVFIGRLHIVNSFEGFPVVSLQKALDEELNMGVRIGSIEEYNCETDQRSAQKKLSCAKIKKARAYVEQQADNGPTPRVDFVLTGEP